MLRRSAFFSILILSPQILCPQMHTYTALRYTTQKSNNDIMALWKFAKRKASMVLITYSHFSHCALIPSNEAILNLPNLAIWWPSKGKYIDTQTVAVRKAINHGNGRRQSSTVAHVILFAVHRHPFRPNSGVWYFYAEAIHKNTRETTKRPFTLL